ncbi:hypothetical protein [Desulfosporosinus shakirovi]|uniref:hypothetical protein n=1 Tax=Desulfosporosinus shakirovi TaxID=2885154 RepID=UPI001E5FCC1B|nr:hypothetical protein [Desulfosporosinus sp. SRJS8]MCB8815429.1 hypothetical protein [Desulfosporosinus sp. SRJS8]
MANCPITEQSGVKRCLALFGPLAYGGKTVLLKPNFNTADPAPGSTHNDTLEQLLLELQAAGPASLTVGERRLMSLLEKGRCFNASILGVASIIELPNHNKQRDSDRQDAVPQNCRYGEIEGNRCLKSLICRRKSRRNVEDVIHKGYYD